nr:ATPase [Butyricicoccus sp. AF10-3]
MATLEELINRMYDMVQDAKGIPLAGEKCIVERDHMLDMLDELREALPNDLQQAQEIVAKRSEMLASGKREAEAIRRQAEEDARQMVSETEIVVAARRKARKYRAMPRFRLVSCAAWQMSTVRIPSSVPRRQ